MSAPCESTKSTHLGLLECHNSHNPLLPDIGHYHDEVKGHRFVARYVWHDGMSGYGSVPPELLQGPF